MCSGCCASPLSGCLCSTIYEKSRCPRFRLVSALQQRFGQSGFLKVSLARPSDAHQERAPCDEAPSYNGPPGDRSPMSGVL